MIDTENNSLLKTLRILLIGTPFLFTLAYVPSFMFPGSFSKAIFLYLAVSMVLTVWLIHIYRSGVVIFKQNWINIAVLGYVLILFVSAIAGGHFEYSFFGSITRMTGIATMLYISGWYFVASSVLRPCDWKNVFRSLLFSGLILAIISFLGINGFGLPAFNFLDQGGSLFTNNTFSGIYYLFAFFFGIILFFQDKSLKWRISYVLAMLVIIFNPDIFNFQIWQDFGMTKEVFSDPVLILGTARASSAVMGVGIIFTLVMYVAHRIRMFITVKSIIFSLVLLALLAVSIGFVISTITQKGFGADFLVSQSDIHRPTAWRQVSGAFLNKPLLGYGPNNFEYAFQDTLSPETQFIAGANLLDKAHNIWLALLLETGILGTLSMIILFLLVCWYGFRHYRSTRDLSTPVIILLLVLHFIQIQTSFNTNTSLFMIFILFAYIASFSSQNLSYTISRRNRLILLSVGSVVIIIGMIATAIIPARHNLMITNALASGDFKKRMNMYESSRSIYGYPAESVYKITKQYTNALRREPELFNDERAIPGIAVEYNKMLDLFESHYEQYNDNLRYHLNYINMIFIAQLFGVDRLDRAGELIVRAKELSTAVPQVFWLASLHAKYTGNEKLAFEEVDKAIKLFESIRGKFTESQLGKFHSISLNLRKFLEKTRGSKEKVYFHIKAV